MLVVDVVLVGDLAGVEGEGVGDAVAIGDWDVEVADGAGQFWVFGAVEVESAGLGSRVSKVRSNHGFGLFQSLLTRLRSRSRKILGLFLH